MFSEQQKRPLEYEQGMEANKRIRTSNEPVEVGMLFQHVDLGPVIGKGGENIKNIRQESGAQVHTSKFVPGMTERTAKIMGSAEQVSSAIKMIIDTGSKDHPMITLLAEYKNCGILIGKQGVTIKQIRDETQANISVSKDCIGNSTQKEIRITGEYEAVTKAVDAVVVHIAEGKNPTRVAYAPGNGMMGFSTAAPRILDANSPASGRGWTLPPNGRFPISPSARGGGGFQQQRFVGRPQGMTQNGFQNERNFGNRGGAASAIRMEMTLWVSKDLIGKIIGRGGLTVKTIRDQSTAHVYVHKDEEDAELTERKITIKGNKKSIDVAYSMIETLVAGG